MKNSRPPALLCLVALASTLLATAPLSARPELCEQAALRAAAESGVPADVLLAIALVETGRAIDGQMRPWPWAANAEGRGHWFASADQAGAFARQRLAQGRPSFDLGCFQINWRWHGQHFDRPEALLDPLISARYAAQFLARLHDELGDWESAAGAYHSRTPHLAQRYRARFNQRRAALGGEGATPLRQASALAQGAASPPGTGTARDRPESLRPASGRLATAPQAGTDDGPNRRTRTRLALLQPGTPARDPASLVPATPASTAATSPPGPVPRTPQVERGTLDHARASLVVPANGTHAPGPVESAPGAAALALHSGAQAALFHVVLPAFIPALAGASQ